MLRHAGLWSLMIVALAAAPAWSQESANPAESPAFADLIKQLDADSFADRTAASEKLLALGKEAISPLAEAAHSPSAETATRALDILRKHFDSPDAALKTAAKAALDKIAAADKGASSRRAADILKPKPVPAPANAGVTQRAGFRLAPRPVIGIAPARAGIEVRAAAGVVGKRISMRTVDGVRQINVVEGDRAIQIIDNKEMGIKVKVTEKKDGKEDTKEYDAKNADELKTVHAEAHKYYEQFGKKADGGVRIEGIAVAPGGFAPVPIPLPFPGFPAPAIRVVPDAAAARQVRELTAGLEKTQKQLEAVAEQLKKIDTADKADLDKAIESLEAAKKELAELKDRAGK